MRVKLVTVINTAGRSDRTVNRSAISIALDMRPPASEAASSATPLSASMLKGIPGVWVSGNSTAGAES